MKGFYGNFRASQNASVQDWGSNEQIKNIHLYVWEISSVKIVYWS